MSKGLGGLPDYLIFKDYSPQTAGIATMYKKVDLDITLKSTVLKESLPTKKDLGK